MLLSFSIPEMLPMIEAGLRQRAGGDIGNQRVKRQTIRQLGPRTRKLLEYDPVCHTIPHALHLWWKSRSRERKHIGTAEGINKIFKIEILHTFMQSPGEPRETIYRIDGPRGWRQGDTMLFWKPGDPPGGGFEKEAIADGFDGAQAYVDYFVPNFGDRFDGALFKW